ncbi:MAG: ABC transporter permease [Anaerolineales bacterium]|nr:ABC transporter permease [Anaerolineales bacterium]
MNSFRRIWIILSKEVSDNLRDRRSILSAMASSLIGPFIILLMIVILGRTLFADFQKRTFDLPVLGAEYAPELMTFLRQNGVVIQPGPEDPEAAVKNGDLQIVLVIPGEDYAEDLSAGRPATVQIVLDASRQSASVVVERTRVLLKSYSNTIAMLRLMARGVDPNAIRPLQIEERDVSTPQTQALIFLNMMPYFVVLVVFVGGMYVVIDATAGERERGSLEPLLINPVRRWELVLGKLFAAVPFAMAALVVTLGAFWLAFNFFPIEDYIGYKFSLNFSALAGIFLIALPMIFLASSIQMIVATATKSFKEAQTYTSLLALVPALPGLGLAFIPVKPNLINMLIPTFGQQIIINQLMRGEPVQAGYAILNALFTLVVTVVLILISVRLYERERIIFGPR